MQKNILAQFLTDHFFVWGIKASEKLTLSITVQLAKVHHQICLLAHRKLLELWWPAAWTLTDWKIQRDSNILAILGTVWDFNRDSNTSAGCTLSWNFPWSIFLGWGHDWHLHCNSNIPSCSTRVIRPGMNACDRQLLSYSINEESVKASNMVEKCPKFYRNFIWWSLVPPHAVIVFLSKLERKPHVQQFHTPSKAHYT